MKKLLLLFLTILTFNLYSQEQFNVILEDTIGHIPNSVIEANGSYYVLSGTGNDLGVRSMCITTVNSEGTIIQKDIFDNDTMELWEGWNHSLKESGTGFFTAGTAENILNNKKGFTFLNFDSEFNLNSFYITDYGSFEQKCFNSLRKQHGDVYITGQYYDDSLGSYYLYLTKFDTLNNQVWRKTITDSYSYGAQLLECRNGSIICGGGQSNSGTTRWLIASFKANGENNWSDLYGKGSVKALLETPDSCILECGSYSGIEVFEDTYYDGCIRKINQNGELIWERFYRNYGGHPTDTDRVLSRMNISACENLPNGDLIVIGSSYSFYTIDRGYMMMLNSEGNIKWHRYYYADTITSSDQYFTSIAKTSDNGFVLLGYGNDYTDEGYDPPQQRWLIKTDSIGIDGLCNTEPDALEVDIEFPDEMCAFDTTEQYLYIAGPTAPYTVNISNGQEFDSIYYPSVFVPHEIGPGTIYVHYNSTTDLEFEEPEVTIANHEWGECIAIPIEYYVGNQVGFVNVDITVTDGWGNSKTISRTVFVKICPDAISSAELENSLQIYPNPASDFLTVEFQENHQSVPVSIIDMHGKEILIYQLTGEKTIIDISALSTGNYQLMIKGISKSFTVAR